MRGIVSPCRRHLGPELHARWRAHLCGLCLTLRDSAGQAARVLTGYDVLLVPVLVEAQAGRLPTTTAGPCALRGMRSAEVVASHTPAMQLGATAALLAGSAGLEDKVADGDIPAPARPVAARWARRLLADGQAAAQRCGFDGRPLTEAPARARSLEEAGARYVEAGGARSPEASGAGSLAELLQPSGQAVAAVFAQTAAVAGVPGNAGALGQAGEAFGRLVHLLDAAEDRRADRRAGRFNPLEATGTTQGQARAYAQALHASILDNLGRAQLVDRSLADALLGRPVAAAIHRALRPSSPSSCAGPSRDAGPSGDEAVAARRRGGARTAVLGAAALVMSRAALWGGRRRGYGGDPYAPPYGRPYGAPYGGPGYGRGCRGPSCGEILACDCCANLACDDCCGGDSCICCC